MMPIVIQEYLRVQEVGEVKIRLQGMSRWLTRYSLQEIAQALVESQKFKLPWSLDRIEHLLYRIHHPEYRPEAFQESYTPPELTGQAPDLAAYNRLASWGGKGV